MKKGQTKPKRKPQAKKALDAGIKFENEIRRGRRPSDPHNEN